jgi:hypothetical protein
MFEKIRKVYLFEQKRNMCELIEVNVESILNLNKMKHQLLTGPTNEGKADLITKFSPNFR